VKAVKVEQQMVKRDRIEADGCAVLEGGEGTMGTLAAEGDNEGGKDIDGLRGAED
jgi:hypothetical protein